MLREHATAGFHRHVAEDWDRLAALGSEELRLEIRRRINHVVGTEASARARAADRLGYAKSTVTRWCDGTMKLSDSAAQQLDRHYADLIDELDWTSFTVLQRLAEEVLRREAGGVAWIPPELGGSAVRGPFLDRDSTYRAVAEVLRACDPANAQDRVLDIASLHGHSGVRLEDVRPAVSETSEALDEFDAALRAVYLARGKRAWHIRQLFTIPTPARLEIVLSRLEAFAEAPGLEVKAYAVKAVPASRALPVLAPLVIGRSETFLGVDDERIYRISSAVQITGRAMAAWTRAYFDRLWNPAPFTVRTLVGLDEDGVERLWRAVQGRRGTKRSTGS